MLAMQFHTWKGFGQDHTGFESKGLATITAASIKGAA